MNKGGLNVVFAGTPEFAADHLAALMDSDHRVTAVITQPDKPGKRGKNPVPSPVKTLALDKGLPLIQPERLTAQDLSAYPVDLIVVVAYGQILRPPVLALPRFGCINVHASLLPRWRGAAPIQRAILAGDHETGICIMQMDEGLDTGDVLRRQTVGIDPKDTTASLSQKLSGAGQAALISVLDEIANGTASPVPQDDEGATYAKKIEKEEARIDWTEPAESIDRCIRAFNPEPIAWTMLADLRVKIWQAELQTSIDPNATPTPGEIMNCTKDGVRIACGFGSINITRLQLPVGKGTIMSPADLINAHRPEFDPGNRFY